MIVNGLKLPAYLINLVESGHWPPQGSGLADVTPIKHPEDLEFYTVDKMELATVGMMLVVQTSYADLYGIAQPESPDPRRIPVDRAVFMAGEWSEEVICLDYCENLDEPKVVLGHVPVDETESRWQVIAETFEEFAALLGFKN